MTEVAEQLAIEINYDLFGNGRLGWFWVALNDETAEVMGGERGEILAIGEFDGQEAQEDIVDISHDTIERRLLKLFPQASRVAVKF